MKIKLNKIRGFATKKEGERYSLLSILVEFEFNIVLLIIQHESALEPLEFL